MYADSYDRVLQFFGGYPELHGSSVRALRHRAAGLEALGKLTAFETFVCPSL